MSRLRPAPGFTLVEVVVTLVILGILAGIAIATYAAVNEDAQAVSTEVNLATIAQATQALADADGREMFTPADVTAATADLTATAGPALLAVGGSNSWVAVSGPSTRHREVSFALTPDATSRPARILLLAGRSPEGDCALVRMEFARRPQSWSRPAGEGDSCAATAAATPPSTS